MEDGSNGVSTAALEDVAYLSRSANRVAILDALASGPSFRRELTEQTSTSRTTLDRIVNELEDRGWAERTIEGKYVATPTGAHLLDQFLPVVRAAEAIRTLDEAIAWLPTDELTIGLQHFADATVKRPEGDDPIDTVDFMIDLLRDASTFRVLTHLAPPGRLQATLRDGVTSGALAVKGVITEENLRRLQTPRERREQWHDMLTAGTDVYRCEGPIPCNLWIADETVLIKASDPEVLDDSYGVPIVSENDTVREWAHDLIDHYQEAATPVEVDAFAESRAAADEC